MLSATTIDDRRACDKLLGYLRHEQITVCDRMALKGFLAYLITNHKVRNGLWGDGEKRT